MPAGQAEKVKLGRTGLAVSKLCFGTSAIGDMPETFGYSVDADQARATLQAGPIRRIEGICSRHGVPTGAAALQFSMRDSRVTSTVIGVSKPERIAQTLEWANWSIPDAAWDELLALPYATDDPQSDRHQTSG